MNKQEYNDAKLRDAVERLPRMERDPSVIEAAERQMQQWLLVQKGQRMLPRHRTPGHRRRASARI